MAAPNLKSPTTINEVVGKTIGYPVTTTLAAVLSNPANSNKVLKVNTVYCSNVDASNNGDIDLTHYNGTVDTRICLGLTVPVKATQPLIMRDAFIYLEEGQSLRAKANAATRLELLISYEEIS